MGRECSRAAALLKMCVANWADLAVRLWMQQRAVALLALVRNEAAGTVEIRPQARHRQASRTQWSTVGFEQAFAALALWVEWHGGEATSLMEILVDAVRVKGTSQAAKRGLRPWHRSTPCIGGKLKHQFCQ